MSLKIEPVKIEEIDLLVQISRETFYETFHQQNTKEDMAFFLDTHLTKEVLQQELAAETNHFFFTQNNKEIAGYLKLSTEANSEIDDKEVLEIARVYVVKDKIGAGVGKAMIEFAIQFARSLSKTTIFLGVWEHNERAIRFYTKFGFEKFGEHVFMVGNDRQTDWLMKKPLAPSSHA